MNIDNRPKFLNLLKIYMPVTAVVSIIHRVSGVVLSLFIPVAIYLFGLSLQGNSQFEDVMAFFTSGLMQLLLGLVLLSLLYHLLAGIRFLLMDFDIGHSLKAARGSAWLVLALTIVIILSIVARCVA